MVVTKQKRKKCGWSASLFMGSIFERTHLNFETLLIFVTYFVQERFTYQFKLHELGLSLVSFTDWSSFYWEVMVHWALDQQGMIMGQGWIVEIDVNTSQGA